MALEKFLGLPDPGERSLVVVNRTEPEPFQELLEKTFANQDVAVTEETRAEYDDDTVLLVEDDGIVATSPLRALEDAILLVNSDLFITGTQDLEGTEVPPVIDRLTEYPFYLQGYPESNMEKLLLILISRRIEKLAFEHSEGTLRSSFQRLSRIDDEKGTRRVYERVADTDVDVHVYGQPDWTPSPAFPVTIHGGYTVDFRESWFVVHVPEDSDDEHAALVAIERGDNEWEGFWTYRKSLVTDIAEYVRQNL